MARPRQKRRLPAADLAAAQAVDPAAVPVAGPAAAQVVDPAAVVPSRVHNDVVTVEPIGQSALTITFSSFRQRGIVAPPPPSIAYPVALSTMHPEAGAHAGHNARSQRTPKQPETTAENTAVANHRVASVLPTPRERNGPGIGRPDGG
jgi:hypothetical protein